MDPKLADIDNASETLYYQAYYDRDLENLTPDRTYYFVAYNDSYGFFSTSEYQIEVEIYCSVNCGWLGTKECEIESYYNYDYRQMIKDKLIEWGQDYKPLVKGVIVTFVYPDSPADLCGIKAEDIICRFGGVDIADIYGWGDREKFWDLLEQTRPGETYRI